MSFKSGFTPGKVFPVTLSLTQSQSDVTGTMALGGFNGPFTGVAQTFGTLTDSAAMIPFSNAGLTIRTNVSEWNSTVSGSSMQGTFTITIVFSDTTTGTIGAQMTIGATIAQLVRA